MTSAELSEPPLKPAVTSAVAGMPVRFFRSPLNKGPSLGWVDFEQLLIACGVDDEFRAQALETAPRLYPMAARQVMTSAGPRLLTSAAWTCDTLAVLHMPESACRDLSAGFRRCSAAQADGMHADDAWRLMEAAFLNFTSGEAA